MQNGIYALPTEKGFESAKGIEVKDGMGRAVCNASAIVPEMAPGWEPKGEWLPLNEAQAQYLAKTGLAACQSIKA